MNGNCPGWEKTVSHECMNMLNNSQTNPGIAVVGSGYWGRNLVRNYYELGALAAVCDRNEELLGAFREQYPGIKTCAAYFDLLQSEEIQGVAIATPVETHYALARDALLAGKHVYVEKPLVLDEEEGRDLIRLAERRDKVLMVGHLLQYHPVFVRLRELVAKGELGRLSYISSSRLILNKISHEKNILWSFAPHDVSMILSLAGEEPKRVQATGGCYLHRDILDVTTTHMEFPSGLQAHIFSWLHPFKEQRLVVVGEKKMAVFDDTKAWQDKLLLYPHRIRWENSVPFLDKEEPERVDIPWDEPLKLECKHFLSCISNGCTPMTDGRDGLRVLRVLHAAQSCLDDGDFERGDGESKKTEKVLSRKKSRDKKLKKNTEEENGESHTWLPRGLHERSRQLRERLDRLRNEPLPSHEELAELSPRLRRRLGSFAFREECREDG